MKEEARRKGKTRMREDEEVIEEVQKRKKNWQNNFLFILE